MSHRSWSKQSILVLALALLPFLTAFGQISVTVNAFPHLKFDNAVDLEDPNDGTNRLFIVGQNGVIWVVVNDTSTTVKNVFLDISDRVNRNGSEPGLLAMAFHPDYATNGIFYTYYTTGIQFDTVDPLRNVLSKWSVSADPDVADATSEEVLMEFEKTATTHNAGKMIFGPSDGYLYLSLGDGGCCGDPNDNAQNPLNLFGTIIRIDVDNNPGNLPPDCGPAGLNGTLNYSIPADNPFVSDATACDEIWAYGLRNPWRWSFDGAGRMWVGDVGDSRYEEVSWVEPGKNYGWDIAEGMECFGDPANDCGANPGLEPPVWLWKHFGVSDATVQSFSHAIIGGYVYEGSSCDQIAGQYIVGGKVVQNIWGLTFDDTGVLSETLLVDATAGISVSSFGVDHNDELYVIDRQREDSVTGKGSIIYRFACDTPLPVELTSFEAKVDGGAALITWTTASEQTNAGFEVNGQYEDGDWEVLGFVEGAGTTNEPQSYSYRVEGLAPGTHRFRIRQFDFDGSFQYHPAVEVTVAPETAFEVSEAYPNPFNPQTRFTITLRESQRIRIVVFDLLGRQMGVVFDGQLSAGTVHSFTIDAEDWPSGLYIYEVAGDHFHTAHSVTLVK
jgi:glucose/arabinose dehydrogenase